MTKERFIELAGKEQESLRRFLLALCCGDRQEAEDIAQDTLIKAYINISSFKERVKFSTWLFKIAYNTFLDTRKSASAKIQKTDLGYASGVSSGSSADCSYEYQALYQALEQIPERERTAILLHYIVGYSVKESATIMKCSEGAVKLLLLRGREKLKTKMDLI